MSVGARGAGLPTLGRQYRSLATGHAGFGPERRIRVAPAGVGWVGPFMTQGFELIVQDSADPPSLVNPLLLLPPCRQPYSGQHVCLDVLSTFRRSQICLLRSFRRWATSSSPTPGGRERCVFSPREVRRLSLKEIWTTSIGVPVNTHHKARQGRNTDDLYHLRNQAYH